ncbi:MAG: GDP-mannose 4,6-dehydratase [bacterium]|nr:GDP-mannose 4,6-dehydratase [bacterium]
MNVLITGAGGFVGQHLIQQLLASAPQHTIHGTVLRSAPAASAAHPVQYHQVDLRHDRAVDALVQAIQPNQVYHLAAQANVARSFEQPWETLENNIRTQITLFEALRALPKPPRIVLVTSGEIYGTHAAAEGPFDESAPFQPSNPYSVSKVTQDMLGFQYWHTYQLPVLRARPFNHLGPGQNLGFVAPDFAMQIARIEAGLQAPVMHVGTLTAERDFTDVRDIVRAYLLIMAHGEPGAAYNVATGTACTVRHLLDVLLGMADVAIDVQTDPTRVRPGSAPKSWGDSSRLRIATGWQPALSLEQTLRDVLNDCRQRVQESTKADA